LYLSRLTAYGFKSFAQKLELGFQRGITCVVGPNGCGKSNVVDALRWALGEQRARALRSSLMEDVIFSGSRTRKPLGMAEVSVTIDNSRKLLPVDFSEVTVTRRLFRSGESDYLLNKIPCRLMDIQNLFMDTGVGAHAYSVIEQGMVDEIISDKTEERRRVFEEAAGVTRYKIRRRSAWNKLQSIQQDLQRIDDIIGEVERQVAYLARQERKARRYKVLMDQLAELEVQLAQYRYYEMADRARPMLEEMSFLKEDVEVGNAKVARMEARLEEVRAELAQQDQALSAANAEVSRQVDEVHRKDREILIAREEMRSIEGFLARSGVQQEALSTRQAAAEKEQLAAEEGARDAQDQFGSSSSLLEEEAPRLSAATEELDARRMAADTQRSDLITLLRDRSDRSGRLERVRAELEAVTQRRTRLSEDLRRIHEREEEAGRVAREATEQIQTLGAELEDTQKQLQAQLADREARGAARTRTVDESHLLRTRVEANSARVSLLERLREGFEGYSGGVRALAVDSPFSERIRGVVADLVDVAPEHVTAVEVALGRALECMVVGTTDDALEAMAYLRSGEHGTAAFIPLDRVSLGTGMPWALPEGRGVVGRASDLVVGTRGEHGAVRSLLRNTLVVRDAEAALAHTPQAKSLGVDIVTLGGELFAHGGPVFGGSGAGDETGLLGRAQETESLQADLEADRTRLAEVDAHLFGLEADLKALGTDVETSEQAAVKLNERLTGLRRDEQNAATEVARQAQLAGEAKGEASRLGDREAELREAIAVEESALLALEQKREELEAEVEQADLGLREQELQCRSQQDAVAARRVEVASLRGRSERLSAEGIRLAQERRNLGEEASRLSEECTQSQARQSELQVRVAKATEELSALHVLQGEAEKTRDEQAERHQELLLASRGLEDDLRERSRKVTRNRDRLHTLEVELAELKTRADNLLERMQEDRGVDLKAMGRLEDPEFSADISEKRVMEMQERLRRMGTVNLAALEEYEVQKERYEFLAKQRDDLLDAEETLKRTITRIDRTARARFLDTYGKIRESFHRTFAAFFEGGEADLSMPSDQDPLEAPIDITARPRGKRLQHINLLSGGERALTAIALLFAIYLVKPSPFCILDEVDAPLDDANVDRFLRVVQEFAEGTQFVVVTHNKRTMEMADCLHGITMEEPGVSKLVTVKIGERENGGNGHAVVAPGAEALASANDD